MKRYLHSSVTAIAVTAMVISGVAVATVSLTAAPAFSKGANSNSNSNSGRDNNNRGGNRNGRGATTISVGALNAARANEVVFTVTSESTRAGIIELYKVAVVASADAKEALRWFEKNCAAPTEITIEKQCEDLLAAASAVPEVEIDYAGYLKILTDEAESLKSLEEAALELAANNKTDDGFIDALWDLLEPDGF